MGCEVSAPKESFIEFGAGGSDDRPLPQIPSSQDLSSPSTDETFEGSQHINSGISAADDHLPSGTEPEHESRVEETDPDESEDPSEVDNAADTPADHGDDEGGGPHPLLVEIHTTDMWGQGLENPIVLLNTDFDESLVPEVRERYVLPYGGTFMLSVSANHYEHAELILDYDGGHNASDVSVWRDTGEPFGFALRSTWANEESDQQVLHIHVGLPHRYFASSGAPIRTDGHFQLFRDGESAWSRVHRALENARDYIHVTAWWWESDFELVRPVVPMNSNEREQNTILSIFERSPVQKRVLLWSHPTLAQLNIDDALLDHAERRNHIEVLGIHNDTSGRFHWSMPPVDYVSRMAALEGFDEDDLVTDFSMDLGIDDRWVDLADLPLDLGLEHASFHQKSFVIDDRMAFVGGMNLKSTDWDTLDHRIYDDRRMYFESDGSERRAVLQGERRSDVMPRKDYMVQLEGRIAADVNRNFQSLWQDRIDAGSPYSQHASPAPVREMAGPSHGGVPMQIVRTMPAPYHDYSVLETYLKAVRNANQYILIEDQYWRAPLLVDAILSRMAMRPTLQLIVVTNDISEWTDPGCFWTATTHQWLQTAFPDRYHAVRMASFAAHESIRGDHVRGEFQDVFIHSKLLIVDDIFMSIGSTNTNHRGFLYEYELNVNVFGRRFVRPIRQDVMSHLVGAEAFDGVQAWIEQLNDAAEWNSNVSRWWAERGGHLSGDGRTLPRIARPRGFVYPLHIRAPHECLIESIGQDITRH